MRTESIQKTLLIGAITALLASLLVYRPGYPGLWLQTLFEWSHVPVFGLISLCLLALIPKTMPVTRRFVYAMLGSLVLAAASEAAQIPTKRDASWEDFFADFAGAASFLMAAFALGKRPLVTALWAVPAVTILVWSATELITVTQAIAKRNFQFPVIFDGDIRSISTLVRLQNVQADSRKLNNHGQEYTRIELSGAYWSLVEFHDIYPNWGKYTNLILDLEIEGESAMELNIRIHDHAHGVGNQNRDDRFDRKFELQPGRTELVIPIRDIASAPHSRRMDITEIDTLVIYSTFRNAYRFIRLYELRLD